MAYEPKTFLTNPSGTGDKSDAQNDPDSSLGGWCSSTEMSLTIGNLWEKLSLDQLQSSTTYRCVCLANANTTDTLEECRVMSGDLTSFEALGFSLEFGLGAYDTTTQAPNCADENTPPAGVTFFAPHQAIGANQTDWSNARKIGALNTLDNDTDITVDENVRTFLFIKLSCANVDAGSFDGSNNLIPINVVGADGV